MIFPRFPASFECSSKSGVGFDTEVGFQIALCNMDTSDGKLDMYRVIEFSPRLEAMLKKFDDASIPIGVITDANGFKKALDSAYTPKFNNTLVIGEDNEYNSFVPPIYSMLK